MIKIDPSHVLTEFDGTPLRTGEVRDTKKRMELASLKDEANSAKPGETAVKNELYLEALKNAQPLLTLGTVIINVFRERVEGDDRLPHRNVVERDLVCEAAFKAERARERMELSAEMVVQIKDRTAKLYNPRVTRQVVDLLEGKVEPPANAGRAA